MRYLARNRRVQDTELLRLDVTAVDRLGDGRAEVHTREQWQVHSRWAHGGGEAEPRRSQTLHGRYLVVRGGKGWRVRGLGDGRLANRDRREMIGGGWIRLLVSAKLAVALLCVLALLLLLNVAVPRPQPSAKHDSRKS